MSTTVFKKLKIITYVSLSYICIEIQNIFFKISTDAAISIKIHLFILSVKNIQLGNYFTITFILIACEK